MMLFSCPFLVLVACGNSDGTRREEINNVRSLRAGHDRRHVTPNLSVHLFLERAGKGQFLSFANRREFVSTKAVDEGSEALKVPALIPPDANWPSRRKDIETNTMTSEMTTQMLKLMMAVSFGKVLQGEPDLLNDLVD